MYPIHNNLYKRRTKSRDYLLRKGLIKTGHDISRRHLVEQVENIKNVKKELRRGEILLGGTDLTFEQPVTVKFNPKKRVTYLVSGRQGSGKTVLSQSIMEQMIDNTGIHCCAIDPKGDLANVDMPLQQPHLVERLNSFGIQPKGYKIKTLYPYFMDLKYVKGSPFCLGMKNIKQLNNKAQVVDVLSNILDVGTRDENPAKEILNNLVYSLGDATKDVEPNSLETLPDKVLSNTEDSFLRRVLYHTTERAKSLGRAQKSISLKLMNQTVSAIKQLKLSDQINYDFPKELVNNEILVIRSVIEKDKSGDSAYIATVLSNIVSNRTLWLDSKGREGIISKPVVVYIDETDTLCGTDKSPSQEIIQRITTKYRRIGISLVLATQSPQMIDKGVLRETECIMSSRFNSEEERKAFANKGVSLRKISEIAMKLHFDKNNPVKEFIKVNEQGELETFYPTPSKSAIIQQSEI